MPIFEYECRDCGSKFEQLVQTQQADVSCRQCESPRVDRLLSVFAVSGSSDPAASGKPGPCACGAPRRGMCGE